MLAIQVSCVMPTCNRRPLVGRAIEYFLRQNYPYRELVIVDDGEDPISDLVPNDARIRLIRLNRRTVLGAKRNVGCEMSSGDLIANWDDDDWMSPHRLTVQVQRLLETETDVCGLSDVLHYEPRTAEAWLYTQSPSVEPGMAGGTLVYRRAAWAKHPFPETHGEECAAFLRQVPAQKQSVASGRSLYVALIHGGNTALRSKSEPCWERRPLHEAIAVLNGDSKFYAALRNGFVPRELAREPGAAAVAVGAHFDVATGYGIMAEYLVRGLARAGAAVHTVPFSLHTEGLSAEFLEISRRSRPDPSMPTVYFSWPRPELDRLEKHADLFINTMWESGRLPQGWAQRLNRARAVIVPTRFVARVCRDSGVTVPVEVVPEGIDPDVYYYVDRPERAGITVLIISPLDNRKHAAEGIEAWKRSFADDPDARLIIKTQYNYKNYVPDDPRIRYVDEAERTRGILHWYRQADVLLALGNEGFGLPLVEAMASGLPVIALNSEGQADICEDAKGCLLPVEPERWTTYHNALFGDCGLRGVPSVERITAHLRWIREHRDEARDMGRAASEWATKHRNVWNKGPAVLDTIERHARPARSLRRRVTMWNASLGTSCGVAEYSAQLSEVLALVRLTRDWPGVHDLKLLHVQHGERLFHENELADKMRVAREAGVPVLATVHTVRPSPRAFEREADVLVALSERGRDMLRRSWPGKRVEHIPCGCPTWFPPRKRKRGCVIGAFGFLEMHKGFWRLLDVLRLLPGSELLLFSYAKSPATEAAWNEAARGLPVRRVSEYLPAEEVARRLAAEADVLVFWYDEALHGSASAAVTVGLATGVPVLTSPTSWFKDVAEGTYQPENLFDGVRRLLDDSDLRDRTCAAARDYCHRNSWSHIADRHLALWRTIESR